MPLRDYEAASSARDALSEHHYRGSEDLNLCLSATFKGLGLSLVVIESYLNTLKPTRLLVAPWRVLTWNHSIWMRPWC